MATTILKRTAGSIAGDLETLHDSLRILDEIMSAGICEFDNGELTKYDKTTLVERQIFLGGINARMVREMGVLVTELYKSQDVTA